ncbi:MAG: CHASE2 domain-containing protein [Calditrichaeota bacterium]|nr:MAG: CHASE2 domain-containing protein [Calditrichota bacterium]MBL1206597.1 CHASE2 domain-containing protein [Calditrichota bacterium]NOG46424.1 sigma 54-interacting transcriptional regulator [Calditrichota bacterium]
MLPNFSGILDKKISATILLIFLFGFLAYLPLPWDEPVDDALISLQTKIRGNRPVGEKFVVVYIGDEDLEALGGWPLTRDYYSYLVHILKSSNAKVIAIDLLFGKADNRHPEFDQTFSTFLQSSGNVCLPMVFSELLPQEAHSENLFYIGENPTYPIKQFRENAAAVGFSNFAKSGNVLKVPLKALNGDETYYSFGTQIARMFESGDNENPENILYLNHFGDLNQIQSISFVELLKKYSTAPDSIDFENKLVLVTVTAPGVSTLKSTPLTNAFPASLIHLTVAENLINKNFLVQVSYIIQLSLLIIILIGSYFINFIKSDKSFIIFSSGLIILFWVLSQTAFSVQNLIVPIFYPTLAFLSAFTYFLTDRFYQKNEQQSSLNKLMNEQLSYKENQLKEAVEKLNQQEISSDELKDLANQRKREILQLEKDIEDLKIYHKPQENKSTIAASFKDIVHSEKSPMLKTLELVLKVSKSDIPVLIMGETGTGKEMIARAIHSNSIRKNQPFVAVNCSALSETLLESELFGHERGSFTGASTLRRGRFEMADGGSIFLDEISETSNAFQAKLLRVLQESTFERIGGEKTLTTNIRVIAATNKNLNDEIEQEKFRTDLFYRLNGFPVNLPALRERQNDIPLLAQFFLKKYNYELEISEQAIKALQQYNWPGNVRELENKVQRAAIIVQSDNRNIIKKSDFDDPFPENSALKETAIHMSLEKQIIETMRSLNFSRSSISQTAQLLGKRDRGTITEYFRGICFEYLVNANFDIDLAAKNIADSKDAEIIDLVKTKISTYLNNLDSKDQTISAFKGLPKKYHPFLEKVLNHLNK